MSSWKEDGEDDGDDVNAPSVVGTDVEKTKALKKHNRRDQRKRDKAAADDLVAMPAWAATLFDRVDKLEEDSQNLGQVVDDNTNMLSASQERQLAFEGKMEGMKEHIFLNDLAVKEMEGVRMEIEQIKTLEDRVDGGFQYSWKKLVSVECGREGLGLDGSEIDEVDENIGSGMDPEVECGSSQSSASSSEDRQTRIFLADNFMTPQIRHAALVAACRCCDEVFETTPYGLSLPSDK